MTDDLAPIALSPYLASQGILHCGEEGAMGVETSASLAASHLL